MRTLRCLALVVVAAASILAACSSSPTPLSPDENKRLETQALGTKHDFEVANPSLKEYFKTAYGYAIFPRVTGMAIGIGGAGGNGLVYEGNKQVGVCDLTVLNIGASLGGKRFSEVIFFQNKSALEAFKAGTLEFDARASAVAAGSGSGTAVDYVNGVRVFTQEEGGLMFEAAIGGQKFRYLPNPR